MPKLVKSVGVLAAVVGWTLVGCSAADTSSSAPAPSQARETGASADNPASDSTAPTSATPTPTGDPDKVLYLTFDDGPSSQDTDALLKILAKSDAKATFFVNGNMVQANPKQAKAIAAAGHAIGNHTYNHPHLPTLSDSEIRKQLSDAAKAVGPAMGACVRPPYLDTDSRVKRIIKSEGYSQVMGDLGAQDWTTPPVSTLESSLRSLTKNKNVIILHDGPTGRQNTIAAMRDLVPEWTKNGWTLAALPECVEKLDSEGQDSAGQ